VQRRGNPTRLVIALSVAAALAIFLLYTSFAGGGTATLKPSQLKSESGAVNVTGAVVGPVAGDARGSGLRFALRDIGKSHAKAVPVVYHGSVPDLFAVGRHVLMGGTMHGGVLRATSLTTKCPSKYTPARSKS
jgi:cytochrome c-type biogenesis protein CcmE